MTVMRMVMTKSHSICLLLGPSGLPSLGIERATDALKQSGSILYERPESKRCYFAQATQLCRLPAHDVFSIRSTEA